MSELTECNYCTYQALKADAKAEGEEVELKENPLIHNGVTIFKHGVDVYVDGKWRVWFAKLDDRCCC